MEKVKKMTNHKLIKWLFTGLIAAALLGCASSPISKQVRGEVQKNLTFPMVLKDPTAYKGSIILWGGSIIETVTVPEGSEIYVLQTPLDYVEMPEAARYSEGRFIARSSVFLDPEIYKNGKKITLAGEITGQENHPLGKANYAYPVVQIKEIHLWSDKRGYYYPYPYYGYYDWFYSPYGPWWGWRWGPNWYYRYDGDDGRYRTKDLDRNKDRKPDMDQDKGDKK